MPKKVQVTLTGNESKRLIAQAAIRVPKIQNCLSQGHRVLLAGGTTVSAMSEELGYGPMRISGRIDAGGTRSAQGSTSTAHNLLIQAGQAVNADKNIQALVEQMDSNDLIITGANAIDSHGRAALAFAALGGGSRGHALHSAFMQGIPTIILCGLNKLIPDLGAAMAYSGRSGVEQSMGAAIGLYNIFGPIITEIKAFDILFSVQAIVIAGSGIESGEGSRTFILLGEEENVYQAWNHVLSLKGSMLSGDKSSLAVCYGGCDNCVRHVACMYKDDERKVLD
ncbi:hypothetical protein AALA54_14570 [Oscillospiraceae bacterium 44-34]|nr:hypothetical protein [Oscillibacter sp.]